MQVLPSKARVFTNITFYSIFLMVSLCCQLHSLLQNHSKHCWSCCNTQKHEQMTEEQSCFTGAMFRIASCPVFSRGHGRRIGKEQDNLILYFLSGTFPAVCGLQMLKFLRIIVAHGFFFYNISCHFLNSHKILTFTKQVAKYQLKYLQHSAPSLLLPQVWHQKSKWRSEHFPRSMVFQSWAQWSASQNWEKDSF